MEDIDFLSMGTHCSVPACNQLDFLPFACDYCHVTTCLQHRKAEAHACTKAKSVRQAVRAP